MEIVSHASNIKRGNGIVTLEKLEDAIESPADMIEVDLNMTKDGIFSCVHNPNIEKLKIHETEFSTLKELHPEILRIEEVFDIVDNKKRLLLDIKNYGLDNIKIITKLLKILNERNIDFVYESFDLDLLKRLQKYLNSDSILLANLFSNINKVINHDCFKRASGIALASELFTVTNNYKKYLDNMKDNQKLYAWTWTQVYKENEKLFKKFIDKGCNGIITDEVYKLDGMKNIKK